VRDKKTLNDIREFWDGQAKKFDSSLDATTPDPLAKELEIDALKNVLDTDAYTLEAGCGNGYNIFQLKDFLKGKIVGFDYSPSMIDTANKSLLASNDLQDRVQFFCANILDDLSFLGEFQQIYTDRCLINLLSTEQQIEAVVRLTEILQPGGRLILVESTQQGQEALNGLRKQVGLEKIPYHWHNFYLEEDEFLDKIPSNLRLEKAINFSSLYFVISRVFNAKLTPEGSNPEYLSEINKIARNLPSFGDYGPLKLFEFKKMNSGD
jgi:SAM-dependent methyltransferase